MIPRPPTSAGRSAGATDAASKSDRLDAGVMPDAPSTRTMPFRAYGRTAVAEVLDPPGTPDATVVLVHGLGCSARAFRRLQAELARSAQVHTLELPGYGRSPRAEGNPSVAEHAALLARYVREHVLAHDGPAPVLVGHSMGAQVVAQALADDPGVGRAAVLVGPTPDPAARDGVRYAVRLARDAVREPPRTVGILLTDVVVRAGVPYYLRQVRRLVAHRTEDAVARVEAPVVVVRGAGDAVVPEAWARLLAATAPRGELHTVRGRHHAMDSDPRALADVVLDAWRSGGQDAGHAAEPGTERAPEPADGRGRP